MVAADELQSAMIGARGGGAGATRPGGLGSGGGFGFGLGGFGGFGSALTDPLAALKSAIATAEAAEGVDEAMLQEAKTLLATQPLQTAMAQRDVATLRTAIEVAEGNADVDRAVVEVRGCAAYGLARYTQYTPHAIMAHTHPLLHSNTNVGGEGAAGAAAYRAASGGDGPHT